MTDNLAIASMEETRANIGLLKPTLISHTKHTHTQATREIKWISSKIKNLCVSKDINNKVKI